ncbi:hypothetical protein L3X07_00340 [Levilactobacillus brevis]|nr:hypothetical protein [Levilactobacillus brevis]
MFAAVYSPIFWEVSPACGRCSNCLDERESQDVTTAAQQVLSCVVRLRSRFGKGVVAQVLTGHEINGSVKTI